MLPNELTTALKEWAVVQRSLLEGHQIILLRKGGLIEESGDFDLRAERFLLYPTYAHETERDGGRAALLRAVAPRRRGPQDPPHRNTHRGRRRGHATWCAWRTAPNC